MHIFKFILAMLIFCASCTPHKDVISETPKPAAGVVLKGPAGTDVAKNSDKELQKILHWFEQMDAIFRESIWVIRKEKSPVGRSIFGKMQRALLIEMKQKLSNKSLFKCDVYSMIRNIPGVEGVPQSAEVMHQCNTKDSFIKIGDWSHLKPEELTMNFRGGNLPDVLGFATGILNPKISCKLKSNKYDIIESFSCDGLMLDYNPDKNQVLRFNQFEYQHSKNNMLYIKAEILENLDPIRKIEVSVPLEGKITITETILQGPPPLARPVPVPTIVPEIISEEDIHHNRNGQEIDRKENPATRGIREPKPIEPTEKNFEEGGDYQEESDLPQVPELPRERNTR